MYWNNSIGSFASEVFPPSIDDKECPRPQSNQSPAESQWEPGGGNRWPDAAKGVETE
jgi:hypothetical protein